MIELYGKIAWLTIIMWCFYPMVWLFSEGFASFSVSFEVKAPSTPNVTIPDEDCAWKQARTSLGAFCTWELGLHLRRHVERGESEVEGCEVAVEDRGGVCVHVCVRAFVCLFFRLSVCLSVCLSVLCAAENIPHGRPKRSLAITIGPHAPGILHTKRHYRTKRYGLELVEAKRFQIHQGKNADATEHV